MVIWKMDSNLKTTSSRNTSIIPETNVILVTSVYTEEGQTANITYWAAEDYILTKDYGLVIKRFLPDDQGVYCCEIMTLNNDLYEHCATVNVTGEKLFFFSFPFFFFFFFLVLFCFVGFFYAY